MLWAAADQTLPTTWVRAHALAAADQALLLHHLDADNYAAEYWSVCTAALQSDSSPHEPAASGTCSDAVTLHHLRLRR